MPAETEAMRKKMCAALAIKRGEMKPNPDFPDTTRMAREMSEEDLVDMCGTPSKEEKKK